MATHVWTNADMAFFFASSNAPGGSNWQTVAVPAWNTAASMNGTTGVVVYASPVGTEILLQSFAFLNDDATIPPVITMTAVQIQFDWTVVCAAATKVGYAGTYDAIPAGGSGSFDHTENPNVLWGGTDRATLFGSLAPWEFDSTAASASQSLTIANYTITVTYTTPSTPAVTSVTPSTGTVNGGQAVTIRGEGFTGALGAEFGGVAVTSFVVVDDATATAVTPAHPSGLVDVEVLGVATGANLYAYTLDRIRLPPMPNRTPMTQGGGKRRG